MIFNFYELCLIFLLQIHPRKSDNKKKTLAISSFIYIFDFLFHRHKICKQSISVTNLFPSSFIAIKILEFSLNNLNSNKLKEEIKKADKYILLKQEFSLAQARVRSNEPLSLSLKRTSFHLPYHPFSI